MPDKDAERGVRVFGVVSVCGQILEDIEVILWVDVF